MGFVSLADCVDGCVGVDVPADVVFEAGSCFADEFGSKDVFRLRYFWIKSHCKLRNFRISHHFEAEIVAETVDLSADSAGFAWALGWH